MSSLDDDSPWDADPNASYARQSEWSKITSDFTNVCHSLNRAIHLKRYLTLTQAGYREGITAGKESALQTGFDDGYAQVGVPLGREIGVLRGTALALTTFVDSSQPSQPAEILTEALREIQKISARLSDIRFSDIAPKDLEAEAHAREHLTDSAGGLLEDDLYESGETQNEEIKEKGMIESPGDVMTSTPNPKTSRPGLDDVRAIRVKLLGIARTVGLELDLD